MLCCVLVYLFGTHRLTARIFFKWFGVREREGNHRADESVILEGKELSHIVDVHSSYCGQGVDLALPEASSTFSHAILPPLRRSFSFIFFAQSTRIQYIVDAIGGGVGFQRLLQFILHERVRARHLAALIVVFVVMPCWLARERGSVQTRGVGM